MSGGVHAFIVLIVTPILALITWAVGNEVFDAGWPAGWIALLWIGWLALLYLGGWVLDVALGALD